MRRFQLLYIQCHSRLLVILEGSLEPIRSKQSAVVNWRLFLRHRVWASFLPVPSQQPSAIIRLPATLPHHSSCLLRHSSRTCRNRGNSCSLITSPPLRLLILRTFALFPFRRKSRHTYHCRFVCSFFAILALSQESSIYRSCERFWKKFVSSSPTGYHVIRQLPPASSAH